MTEPRPSSEEEFDLLEACHWPVAAERALQPIPMAGRVLTHTILKHAARLPRRPEWQDVDRTLEYATTTLRELAAGETLASARAAEAQSALKLLTRAVRAIPDLAASPAGRTFLDELQDPSKIAAEVSAACAQFAIGVASTRRGALATFSLILFRSTDLGGAILKSFDGERDAWAEALRPLDPGAPDDHLAVVPPPDAPKAVDLLVSRLGLAATALPCVVFLGSDVPDFRGNTDATGAVFGIRLGVRGITSHASGIPATLREIYASVYARGAVWPGTAVSSSADALLARINPFALMKLLAGALVGRGGAEAITAAESVVSRRK